MTKKVTPKLVMAILSAGMLSFLGILDETATTVTFPTLIKEFSITTDQVQWVNTLVLLVIATIVPISSQISLRFATKKIFIAGIVFFMLGLVIDIFTPRFDLLLVGRAFQGIGTGIGLPLMYNIILAKVPKDKLGFMMGIGTMITAAAVALGPVFGGIVTALLTWRWIFIISIFLAVISTFTGSYSITQLNKLQQVKFKYGQWLAIAVSLVLLMLGFTSIAKNHFWSFQVAGCLAIGLVSLGIWLKLAWHDHHALISPQLFLNLRFSMQLICYCFAKIATLALGFIFPIYVQTVNHGSVSLAGWIMLPGAICDALMAAAAGKILDKKGARLPIMVGIIASLAGVTMMTVWGIHLSNLAIILLYALYYGGYGMCFSSLMTSGLTSLPAKDHAQGNAIFNTLQQFSGALGTALAGTLIAISQNNHQLLRQQTTAIGARWTFIVLLGLIVLNLIIAIVFVPRPKTIHQN
ncbi:MFS transporter [Limosilactobacillus sp. STM2_1]|uniref:MFS transporter n=1 Tax=Limosilactobacillus rudii TaxID=2759755 RepID=A0A7W3ULK0_9LACO|nr:MFS transporter [Limosilactobacillus rudii]MBB1079761.1 MFS transporter [Limosilactobacillus rudii]MBB1097779.1 MFS transporter [Limosilactobacillus rudii]MCD7134860.1 MFS transporter [Limosilactobacillus rudii]